MPQRRIVKRKMNQLLMNFMYWNDSGTSWSKEFLGAMHKNRCEDFLGATHKIKCGEFLGATHKKKCVKFLGTTHKFKCG